MKMRNGTAVFVVLIAFAACALLRFPMSSEITLLTMAGGEGSVDSK